MNYIVSSLGYFCSLSDNKIADEGARHISCSMHNMVNLEILEYVKLLPCMCMIVGFTVIYPTHPPFSLASISCPGLILFITPPTYQYLGIESNKVETVRVKTGLHHYV